MKHLLIAALVLATGCGKSSSSPPEGSGSGDSTAAPTAPAAAAAPASGKAAFEARRVFSTVCATCHGSGGQGDGPASAGLDPKPRNYTDRAWQASVTDQDLERTIVFGGAAVGKSAVMPGTPQLKEQPEVLAELVRIIRKFGE